MIPNTSKALLIAILGMIICLSTVSYLSNGSTTGTTIQTIAGKQYTLSDAFSILQKNEILPTASTTPASTTIIWSNQSSAHTELVSGHWQLAVSVRMNANAQPNTSYELSLQGSSGASLSSFGSIDFMTTNSINPGEVMHFTFDIGTEFDSSISFIAQIV